MPRGAVQVPTYVHVAPGIDYLERAVRRCQVRLVLQPAFLTAVVPTIVDDSLAPPGKHVINVFGGHAPYTLRTMPRGPMRSAT